ncbi:hypothetical protein AX16_001149 [Volvariella volvacea WC 439]|nr:hypothetical protein AX16_001149 [Volvariella volvacea WC 439]
MAFPFANAPLDIILSIAEHIDPATLPQLRLLSRAFGERISPIALRNLAFRICGANEKLERLLNSSSNCLPAIYKYGRHLTLKTDGWYVASYVDKTKIAGLYKTLERLESLESLKIVWESGYNDSAETTEFVYEIQEKALEAVLKATGGTLNKLVVKPWSNRDLPLPRALGEFKGLRALAVNFDKYGCGCRGLDRWGQRASWFEEMGSHGCIPQGYQEVLNRLTRNSPELQVFEVREGCAIDFYNADELFCGIGDKGSSSDGDEEPLKLRKLTITGVKFFRALNFNISPFIYLQHLDVPSLYSINSLDNLWLSLQATGTTLKSLKTSQVSLPLAFYLASYSGLQCLTIENIEDLPPCTDPKVTGVFFHDALPRHAASLSKLCISFNLGIDYLEGWSFTPELWMPALLSLEVLETLELYPSDEVKARRLERRRQSAGIDNSAESGEKIEDADGEEEEEDEHSKLVRNYQEVLNHIGSLSSLVMLRILWPRQRHGCGTAMMRWIRRSAGVVRKVAEELRSGSGVPRELDLFCGRYNAKRDEPSNGELGCSWRYVVREGGELQGDLW